MMKKTLKFISFFAVASLLSGAAVAQSDSSLDQDSNEKDIQNAKLATVTMIEAVSKVTNAHDGFVISAILESKKGDRLVYEIDFVQNEKEIEVWVDARTGEMSELMED